MIDIKFAKACFNRECVAVSDKDRLRVINFVKNELQIQNKLEYYLPVFGYEHNTLVSNLGNVYSVKYKKIRHPSTDKDGYLWVKLNKDGDNTTFNKKFVHFLVCESFFGPRPDKYMVRHYPDQTKTNNNIENISWSTASQNIRDKYETKNGNVRFNISDILEIKRRLELGLCSVSDIKFEYEISAEALWSIIYGGSYYDITEGGIIVKNSRAKKYKAIKELTDCELISMLLDFKNNISFKTISNKYSIRDRYLTQILPYVEQFRPNILKI